MITGAAPPPASTERRPDLATSRLDHGQPPSALALVNAQAIRDLLPMSEAIDLVAQAMTDLSAGRVWAPERWASPVSPAGLMALMPGAMPDIERFGVKVLSLFDNAVSQGLAGHQGVMALFDRTNGRPLCILESATLTGLRTAAASAVATRALARTEARRIAMIGCGQQADWHVEAMALLYPLAAFTVWGRSVDKARAFAERHQRAGRELEVATTIQGAIARADIICTVTHSSEPIVFGEWLEPGQHLNLVGASTRAAREVDDVAVARGRFIADCRAHALSQGGELRHAIEAGVVSGDHVVAELGDVLAGRVVGRPAPSTITVYKSLGHVAQDLKVANAIAERLERSDHVVKAHW